MKISEIKKTLDMVWKMNEAGKILIPDFTGPAGIGKSQGVHQWVAEMRKVYPGFRMIDRRVALMDPSDFQGLPWKNELDGTTKFLPPDYLPREGCGVLFLDEALRGSEPVTNCLMQLFTEGSIGDWVKPKGWIIATANNPPDSSHGVAEANVALKNRLTSYTVKFDHKTLIEHATSQKWSETVIAYLQTGDWIYKEPGEGDEYYISPRNWEKISNAELFGDAKDDSEMHDELCVAELGKNIGRSYWNFVHKTKPISYDEIELAKNSLKPSEKLSDTAVFKRLVGYSSPMKAGAYRADLTNATSQTFKNKASVDINRDILAEVCNVFPADIAVDLVTALALKSDDPTAFIHGMQDAYPALFSKLRGNVKKQESLPAK